MNKNQLFRACLLGLCCLFSSFQVLAQQKFYGNPFIQTYGQKDHGGGVQNWGVEQDSLGRMYFANTSGTIIFDGHHWNVVPTSKYNTVRSFAKDKDGIIYVGGIGDIGFLQSDSLGNASFKSLIHLVPEEYRDVYVDAIYTISTDQGVFFMSPRLLLWYADGEMQSFAIDENGPFNKAWSVRGKFFVHRPVTGLYELKDDELVLVPGGEKGLMLNSTSSGLLPWDDDKTLLVEYTGNFIEFGAEGARTIDTPVLANLRKVLGTVFINSIVPLPDGRYVLNSSNGGLIITDDQFRPQFSLDKNQGLSNNAIRNGFVDREGNYWAATNTGVSQIMINSPFTIASESEGIDNSILSATLNNDTLYIGTSWGVKYESEGKFVQIPNSQLEIWDIDVVDGLIYAATSNWLERMDLAGDRALVVRSEPWGMISLKKSPGNYLLHHFNHNLRTVKSVNGQLVDNTEVLGYLGDARIVIEDREGFLWISNGNTPIVKLKLNDALDSAIINVSYGKQNGLLNDEGNHLVPYDSPEGLGFLAISDELYYQYDAKRDTFLLYEPLNDIVSGSKFSVFDQTADGTVYTLYGNQEKGRFVKTNTGYVLDTAFFGKIADVSIQDILTMPDSTVLYLSAEGIIQYNPKGEPYETLTFNTAISEVKAGSQIVYSGYSPSIEFLENGSGFDYKSNSIKFSYSAVFFDEPDKNTFSYFLEGYDKQWSNWSSAAYKEYTNLPEGNYNFKVRSKNLYGIQGEESSFEFSIYPPWYRSSLAFGGYGVLVLFVIWLIVRVYTNRLIKEKEKLEEIVRVRTIEIRQQKDEIAIQADKLKDTNDQLVELDRFKQDMTSMIAHDLKNPLGVIIKMGERKAATLAKRMLNLVLNMLDVQKFEETEVQLSLGKTSVNELLNQAIEDVQDKINEANIDLKVDVSSTFVANIDAALLERVLVNLLTNAVKYAPVDSSISIQISTENENKLYFSIRDEGPGIPIEKQSVIFDRYVQVENRIEGSRSTGLGLTFCKMVIEAHRGRIGLESQAGEGAKFWFVLPIVGSMGHLEKAPEDPNSSLLTDDETEQLNKVIPALSALKVYQSTEIEAVLGGLSVETGSGLDQFCQKLINAAYNGDQGVYDKILRVLD